MESRKDEILHQPMRLLYVCKGLPHCLYSVEFREHVFSET